jgi:hypothetical protein
MGAPTLLLISSANLQRCRTPPHAAWRGGLKSEVQHLALCKVCRCKEERRTNNSIQERMTIASMRQPGSSVRAMARTLGRSAATVSRELARNTCPTIGYASAPAQARCTSRREAARPLPSCMCKASPGAWCSRCWSGRPSRSRVRSSVCGPTIQPCTSRTRPSSANSSWNIA